MKRRIALVLALSLLAATLPASLAMADSPTTLEGWSSWWSNWVAAVVLGNEPPEASPIDPGHLTAATKSPPPATDPTATAVPDPGQTVTTTNTGEVYPEFDPDG